MIEPSSAFLNNGLAVGSVNAERSLQIGIRGHDIWMASGKTTRELICLIADRIATIRRA